MKLRPSQFNIHSVQKKTGLMSQTNVNGIPMSTLEAFEGTNGEIQTAKNRFIDGSNLQNRLPNQYKYLKMLLQ